MTIRQKVLLFTGSAAVLAGASVCVLHSGIVRRFALGRIQALLENTHGIILEAGGLNYNLFRSHYELKDLVLRDKDLTDLPAPVRAKSVIVVVPLWDLLHSSFNKAHIHIDGLSVHLVSDAMGRSNLPKLRASGGSTPGGPTVSIINARIFVQVEQAGLSIQLSLDRSWGAWNVFNRAYETGIEASSGWLQWRNLRLPIDSLQLKSTIAGHRVSVESLRIASSDSLAEIAGVLNGSPAAIQGKANLDVDSNYIGQALALKPALAGRLRAQVTAAGPLDGFQLAGNLRMPQLAIGKILLQRPALDAEFDEGTGEFRIRSLSGGLFSGQLRANGVLWTGPKRGRSKIESRLDGAIPRQLADAFGVGGLPSNPATVRLTASCNGLDWRHASAFGSVQSAPAEIGFQATLDQTRIHASLHTVLGDNARVQGDVAIDLKNESLAGTVSGSVSSLAQLGGQVENVLGRPARSITVAGVDGSVRWTSTLGGTLKDPSGSLQLRGSQLGFKGWNGIELELDAHFSPEQIGVERTQVSWNGQQIAAYGKIGGISADAPLNLRVSLVSPSVAPVLSQLGIAAPIEGDLSGDITISGTISQPSAEAALHADAVSVFKALLSRVFVEARWRNGILTISRFTAAQDHGSAAQGHIELSGSLEPASGRYTATVSAANLLAPEPKSGEGLPVSGAFDFTAKGEGTVSTPAFRSDISGRDVRAGAVPLGDITASVDASAHQARIHFDLPALHAEATSTVGLENNGPFEFALHGRNTHLATTPAATFDITVRGSGSLATPEAARATVTIQNLRLATPGQEIVSDGPVELSYSAGRIRVGQMALKAGESTLQLSGEIPATAGDGLSSLSMRGTLRLDSLPHFLPALGTAQVAGVAELNASLRGSAANLQPTGSIAIRDASLHGDAVPLPLERVNGEVNIGGGILRLDRLIGQAGSGTLEANGSLPLRLLSDAFSSPATNPGQPAEFSAKLENIQLPISTAKHPSTTSLSLGVGGEASTLSLAALRATVDFDELVVKTDERDLRQTAPTRISVADSVLRLERLDLKGSNGTVQISGSLGLTGALPVQAVVAVQGDLAAFAPLIAPVEAAGNLRANLQISGTLSDPHTSGFVELDQARVVVPNPLLQATVVKLRADSEGDRVTLKDFNGTLNGGSFTGGGDLKLGGGGIRDANVFLKGKDVFAEFPAGLKTNNSVDVKLVSQKDRLVLQGQVEVQEGFVESALDVLNRSPEGLNDVGRETVGLGSAAAHPLGLDIHILTRRPVEMDNNLGRVSGIADLRLTGTVDQVRVLGSLRLDPDGRLYFGDRTYYIERGTVRFLDAPQITPELDIRAYTRTNYYTIYLGFTGVPSEITTTFTSDPPLSRDDVISVLLTGRTVADNNGVDTRTLEGFSVATGAMNAALSSRLHRTLGVSRVSIQPSAIAAESNPGTRVTITQDFTRTLRMLYSINLTDSSDQIWVGEYDLTRSLTTRLVKQRDNTYRGEFRHDVRFGTSTESASTAAVQAANRNMSAVHFTGETPFAPEVLTKKFKVRAGKRYDALKVRKGSERLENFFLKKGYLESRVRLDRDESAYGVDLTVRIELGPSVEMTYQGANLPRGEKSKLRKRWQSGISDTQRPVAAKNAILDYFAEKGYLRAQAVPSISVNVKHKVVHFDLKPGIHYRDVKVLIEGASPERAKDIQSLIGERRMEVGADRDPSRLTGAVARYYQRRGYLATKVVPPLFKLDDDGNKGRIVVRVTEGPVFHVGDIEFSGNHALTAESLRDGLPIKTGQIFEPARLEPAAAAIRLKYGSRGYREAHVEYALARHDERALVSVKFSIVENRQTSIRSVQIAGNHQTSDNFVQDRLLVAEGQVADTTKIRDSVTNLSRTGAYAAANIEMQIAPQSPTPSASQTAPSAGPTGKNTEAADLRVALVEPKPFRLLYGGLYDNGSGPGFIFDFQNLNTLGPGRTLGFRARYDSDTKESRVYLTQPYWGLRNVATTLSTYFTNQVQYGQNYPTARAGVGFQQDWPLRAKLLLSYGIRFEKERAWVPVNGMQVRTPIVFAAPLTFTISRDARDSFLDATRGSFISNSFEFAPHALGTQFPYIRYFGQYFKYFPLTRARPVPYGETPKRSRLVFATGTRIGLQKGLNPEDLVLTDRFYAGGGTTVRGFQQDSLGPKLANGAPIGGNAIIILNNELRYPLFWIFDAVSFVDVGNVFPQVSDFRVGDLREAAGFGLRIRNPFVVLRFDYGFKLDRRPSEKIGAFFFSIGQAF